MVGLLTRAEEVGFIGAIAHFDLGWVSPRKTKNVVAISLETSRTLPGADIGKGPVVRLGDRASVFHSGYLRVLAHAAEKALPGRHQKRIMDGGTCEATAASAFGIPAIGISVPLGNYHNISFEGGPGSLGPMGPGPEFVHRDDLEGLLLLCRELMKPRLGWHAPWKDKHGELKKRFREQRGLLRSAP